MSGDTWATPQAVFGNLDAEFGFGFDVCAENSTAKHQRYWTVEDDALSKDWHIDTGSDSKWLWCNPPYSKIGPWVEKAKEAQRKGTGTVMLVMCDPSVKWFSSAISTASEIRFIVDGRLSFIGGGGNPKAGNNKGSVIFVFDPYRIGTGYVSFVERSVILTTF